jgi:hypothetical protein
MEYPDTTNSVILKTSRSKEVIWRWECGAMARRLQPWVSLAITFVVPFRNELSQFLRTSDGFRNRRRNGMNEALSTESVCSASPESGFWKYISFRDIQNNLT